MTTDAGFILLLYLTVLLTLGYYSYRSTRATPEDYFLAGRSLGPVLLFFSVFATNITAFTFLGVTGQSYQLGVGMYGFVAFGTAFLTPAMFYIVGFRSWLVGKRYGYMTQAEILGNRWDSRAVSLVVLALTLLYTIPYLVTSIIGAGTALEAITGGALPYPVGCTLVVAVTTIYTSLGGMRGTAWTNVFQGLMFLIVGLAIFVLLSQELGGVVAATEGVLATRPDLLTKADHFTPGSWFSYLLISPLAVVAFPHVFVRLMSSRSTRFLKTTVTIYPLTVLLTFAPAVYIGLWGSWALPDMSGRLDAVFPLMLATYLPASLTGLGLAAILAAIMSSIDAMLLTISNLVLRDGVEPRVSLPSQEWVKWGRLVVAAVALLSLIMALIRPGTIFAIATFAFTGYACLVPVMIAALYWRRSTSQGALAALLGSAVLLPVYHFTPYLDWTLWGNTLPIIPLLVITIVLLVGVSCATRPATHATHRFFSLFDSIYQKKAP